jgi:hypothetical protein
VIKTIPVANMAEEKTAEKLETPKILKAKAVNQRGRGVLSKAGAPEKVRVQKDLDSKISFAFWA